MPPIKCVRIVGLRAEDLVPQDGKSCDPYVIMKVNERVIKTERIAKNHANPCWKSLADFSFGWDGVTALPELQFTVMDFDYFGSHDFVGFARVQLNKFMIGSGEIKARLGVRSESDSRLLKEFSSLGHLLFKLEYSTALDVKKPAKSASIDSTIDVPIGRDRKVKLTPLEFDTPPRQGSVMEKVEFILGSAPSGGGSSGGPDSDDICTSFASGGGDPLDSGKPAPPPKTPAVPDLPPPQAPDLQQPPVSSSAAVSLKSTAASNKPATPVGSAKPMLSSLLEVEGKVADTTADPPKLDDTTPIKSPSKSAVDAPPPPPPAKQTGAAALEKSGNTEAPNSEKAAVEKKSAPAAAKEPGQTPKEALPPLPPAPKAPSPTDVPKATATPLIKAPSPPAKDDLDSIPGSDAPPRPPTPPKKPKAVKPVPLMQEERPTSPLAMPASGAVPDGEDEWAMVRLGGAAGGGSVGSDALEEEDGADGLFAALRGEGGGGGTKAHNGPCLYVLRLQANNIPIEEGDAIKIVVDHPLGRFESEVQDWGGDDAEWEDVAAEVCPASDEHEITFTVMTKPAGSTEAFFAIVTVSTYVSPMAVGVDTRLDCQPTEEGSAKVPDAASWGAIVFELAATGGDGTSTCHEGAGVHSPGGGLTCPAGGVSVRIMAGANLLSRDQDGSADPYVVLMGEDSNGELTTLFKTDTCRSTLNPKWAATARLDNISDHYSTIVLYVYDEDPGVSPGDFMGQCRFEFRRCPLRGGLPLKLLPRRENVADYKFLQKTGKGEFGYLYIEWAIDQTVSLGSPRPSMSTLRTEDHIFDDTEESVALVVDTTKKKRRRKTVNKAADEMLPGSSFNVGGALGGSSQDDEDSEETEESEEEPEVKEPSVVASVATVVVPPPQYSRVAFCAAGAWRALLISHCIPFVLELTVVRIDKLKSPVVPVIGFRMNGRRLGSQIRVANQGATYTFGMSSPLIPTTSSNRTPPVAKSTTTNPSHSSNNDKNTVRTAPMLRLSDEGITVFMLAENGNPSSPTSTTPIIAESTLSKSELSSLFEDTLQSVIQSTAGEDVLEGSHVDHVGGLFIPEPSLSADSIKAAVQALMSGEEQAEVVLKMVKPDAPANSSASKGSRGPKAEAEITLHVRKVYFLCKPPVADVKPLADSVAAALAEKDAGQRAGRNADAFSNASFSGAVSMPVDTFGDPVQRVGAWLAQRSLAATQACLRVSIVDAFGLSTSTVISPYVTATINSCAHGHALNPYYARPPEKGVQMQGALGVHPDVRTSFHELRKSMASVYAFDSAHSPPVGSKLEFRTVTIPNALNVDSRTAAHPMWLFNLPPLGSLQDGGISGGGNTASHSLSHVGLGRTTVQFAIWGEDPDGFDVCIGGARYDLERWTEGSEVVILPLTTSKAPPSSESDSILGYLRVEVGVHAPQPTTTPSSSPQELVPASGVLKSFIDLLDEPVAGTSLNEGGVGGFTDSTLGPSLHPRTSTFHPLTIAPTPQPLVVEVDLVEASNILPPLATTEMIEYDRRHQLLDSTGASSPLRRGHRGEFSKADLKSMKRRAQKKMNIFACVTLTDISGHQHSVMNGAAHGFPMSSGTKTSSAAVTGGDTADGAFGCRVKWERPADSERYHSSLATSTGNPPPGTGTNPRPYHGSSSAPTTSTQQVTSSSSVLPFLVGGSMPSALSIPTSIGISITLWDGKGSDARFLGEASTTLFDVARLGDLEGGNTPITLNLRPRSDPRFYADDAAVLNHPLLNSGVVEDDAMLSILDGEGIGSQSDNLNQPNGGLGTITFTLRNLTLVQYERERREALRAAGLFYDLVMNISDVSNVDRAGWYCVEASVDSCTSLLEWYANRSGQIGYLRPAAVVMGDSVRSDSSNAAPPTSTSILGAVLGTYTHTTVPDFFAGPPATTPQIGMHARGTVNIRENVTLPLVEQTDSITLVLKRCLCEQQPTDWTAFVPVAQVSVPVGHPSRSGLGNNPPIWLTMSAHPNFNPPLPCPPRVLIRWKATQRTTVTSDNSGAHVTAIRSQDDDHDEDGDWAGDIPTNSPRKQLKAAPPSASRPTSTSARRIGGPQHDAASNAPPSIKRELLKAKEELAALKEKARPRRFEVLLPPNRKQQRHGKGFGRGSVLSDDELVEERLTRILRKRRHINNNPSRSDADDGMNSPSSIEDGDTLLTSARRSPRGGSSLFVHECPSGSTVSDVVMAAAQAVDTRLAAEAAAIQALLLRTSDSPYRQRGRIRQPVTTNTIPTSFDEDDDTSMTRRRPVDVRRVVVQRQEALRAAITEKYALAIEEWVPASTADASGFSSKTKGGGGNNIINNPLAASSDSDTDGDEGGRQQQQRQRIKKNTKRLHLILPTDMPVTAIWDAPQHHLAATDKTADNTMVGVSRNWRLRLVVKNAYKWQSHNTLLLDRMHEEGLSADPTSLVTFRLTTDILHVFTGHPALGRADAATSSKRKHQQRGRGKKKDSTDSDSDGGYRQDRKHRVSSPVVADPFLPSLATSKSRSRILRYFKKVSGGQSFTPSSPKRHVRRKQLELSEPNSANDYDDDDVQLLHFDLFEKNNNSHQHGLYASGGDDDFDDDVVAHAIAAEASYQAHQDCIQSGVTATIPMKFRAAPKSKTAPTTSRTQSAPKYRRQRGASFTSSDAGDSIDSDEEERQFEQARSAYMDAERTTVQENLQRIKAILSKGIKSDSIRGFARPAARECTQQPLCTLHYDHYLSGPRNGGAKEDNEEEEDSSSPGWLGRFYQVELPCVEVYIQGPREVLVNLLQRAVSGFPQNLGGIPASLSSSVPSVPHTPNRSGRSHAQHRSFGSNHNLSSGSLQSSFTEGGGATTGSSIFTDLVVKMEEVSGYIPVFASGFKLASTMEAGTEMFQHCCTTSLGRTTGMQQVMYSVPYDPSDFGALFLDARIKGVTAEVLDASVAYQVFCQGGTKSTTTSAHHSPTNMSSGSAAPLALLDSSRRLFRKADHNNGAPHHRHPHQLPPPVTDRTPHYAPYDESDVYRSTGKYSSSEYKNVPPQPVQSVNPQFDQTHNSNNSQYHLQEVQYQPAPQQHQQQHRQPEHIQSHRRVGGGDVDNNWEKYSAPPLLTRQPQPQQQLPHVQNRDHQQAPSGSGNHSGVAVPRRRCPSAGSTASRESGLVSTPRPASPTDSPLMAGRKATHHNISAQDYPPPPPTAPVYRSQPQYQPQPQHHAVSVDPYASYYAPPPLPPSSHHTPSSYGPPPPQSQPQHHQGYSTNTMGAASTPYSVDPYASSSTLSTYNNSGRDPQQDVYKASQRPHDQYQQHSSSQQQHHPSEQDIYNASASAYRSANINRLPAGAYYVDQQFQLRPPSGSSTPPPSSGNVEGSGAPPQYAHPTRSTGTYQPQQQQNYQHHQSSFQQFRN